MMKIEFNKLRLKGNSSILVYLLVVSGGVLIAFYPTLFSRFSFLQSDPGDTRLVNYFLEHSFQLLTNPDYVGGLWSPAFFYPYEQVLTLSENLFGSAPVYWLFRAFFPSDIAFQLWMITACILCFASFAILMRRLQVGHVLSALGGFLFAFSIPRVAQITHQQLLPQFFTPLAFLSLWDFIKQPTRKRFTLVLLLVYLQVLAGIYLGWFLLFSLVIFCPLIYGLYSEARTNLLTYWKTDRKAIIIITLGWVGLMLLTLFPYLEAKSVLGSRPYSEVEMMLPRIASWFSVPPGSIWTPVLGWTSKGLPLAHEHHMFAGFLVILLTGLSIYTLLFTRNVLNPERTWLVKLCLLVFVAIFCLTLRFPGGFSLWRIIYDVMPGASVIRGVTRIWTMAYFYLLVAVIVCFDSVLRAVVPGKRSRLALVSILCILGICEQIIVNLPSYEKAPLAKEVTEIRELIQDGCDVAYLSLNPAKTFYVEQLSAMWAGIEVNVPVVNGHSGSTPPNYGNNSLSMNTAQVVNWLEPADQDTIKNLCMVAYKPLEAEDSLVAAYTVKKTPSSFNNLTAYTIQLPVPKIFSQEIKIFEVPKTVEVNSAIKMPVLVKNTSNFIWPAEGDHPTRFSYRWIDANGKLAIFDGDGDRTELPWDLAPSEMSALNAAIRTPNIPGHYKLILTMVQEEVAWFNDKTTNNTEIPIEVIVR